MSKPPPDHQHVNASLDDRVDLACDAFEQARQAGQRPKLEEHLAATDDRERAAFFEELMALELACRQENNETPTAEEYAARFPEFREIVVRLIEGRDNGDPTKPRDRRARQRFPIRLNCPHCKNPIAIVDDSAAEEEVLCPSCGSSFRLDPDRTVTWSPEKLPKLGKFELLEPVGRGAFGTVYKAHDTELDRIVAVKVPRSGTFATQEDEDRFVREGRSAAQLSHESIVSVHEVGRTQEFPYIVSEFVHGVTLADLLDSPTGRQFTFRESAELVARIAEALEHSHQRGVIHRDLKPSNLLIEGNEHPRVKVMDFGLARRDDREITMTVDGQVLGTPAYMSPEQAAAKATAPTVAPTSIAWA